MGGAKGIDGVLKGSEGVLKGSGGTYGAGLKGHFNSWRTSLENEWVAQWCGERALRVVPRVHEGHQRCRKGAQTVIEHTYCNQCDQK